MFRQMHVAVTSDRPKSLPDPAHVMAWPRTMNKGPEKCRCRVAVAVVSINLVITICDYDEEKQKHDDGDDGKKRYSTEF